MKKKSFLQPSNDSENMSDESSVIASLSTIKSKINADIDSISSEELADKILSNINTDQILEEYKDFVLYHSGEEQSAQMQLAAFVKYIMNKYGK